MTSESDAAKQSAAAATDAGFQVDVADRQQSLDVDHEWLVRIAEAVLREEGVAAGQISIALVDDPEIRNVNRRFLNHDCPTDVISFLLNDPSELVVPIDAEIVISAETAARSARNLECDASGELALYLVHGLLHLCGYDDQSARERLQMRQREKSHLKKLGIRPHYED